MRVAASSNEHQIDTSPFSAVVDVEDADSILVTGLDGDRAVIFFRGDGQEVALYLTTDQAKRLSGILRERGSVSGLPLSYFWRLENDGA